MKKQLLIAGGTGLIGTAIKKDKAFLDWDITVLSRRDGPDCILWDPEQGMIEINTPKSFDAIINLAGSSIAGGRWTEKRKKDIVDSRLNACRTIEKYLANGSLKTNLYIGASAVGVYGDRGFEDIDDESAIPVPGDWMSQTVQQWETGHKAIEIVGMRTIILRIGIVLDKDGGALKEILQTAPLGFLTYFGKGEQIWPWIHISDLVRIFQHVLTIDNMAGIYLACAPHPVSNKELTKTASQQYQPDRVVMSAPVFALTVLLGEMRKMLFQSCKGYPRRLLSSDFVFRFNTIDEALDDLIKK